MRIKIKHITSLLFFSLAVPLLFAAEKKLVLGGDHAWPEFSRAENIAKTAGRFGKEAVCVAGAGLSPAADTDLLLNFETGAVSDRTGNYTLLSSSLTPVSDSIMGKYAALGKGAAKGLELKGGPQSIFGRPGQTGSFTISFWLNPSLAENGETVFSWRSSRTVDGVPVYQMIAAAFFNNKLEWTFTNVFASANMLKNVTLSGKSLTIPGTWALHSVSFDEETGLIEYCVNGKTEDLAYTTANSRARGTVFLPVLGVPAELAICPGFTGKIDDFCVQKKAVRFDYRQPLFNPSGAYFETKPVGPFPPGTVITGIEAIADTPKETDVQFFVRAGGNYHAWTDSDPAWVPVTERTKIENVGGIWLQVAAALYTDGLGEKTPSITELTLKYTEKDPPLAPVRVFAQAGDGSVDLSWLASAGISADGYIVYYGESPGEYLGTDALEGRSPLNVGNTLSLHLTGLKNGKIYYFAVSAYEDSEPTLEGALSAEVFARPLRGRR